MEQTALFYLILLGGEIRGTLTFVIFSEEALLGFDWLDCAPGNVSCYSVFAISNAEAMP